MKTVTLYSLETGMFKRVLQLPDRALQANVPEGLGFKEGRFDPLSQRVDLESGAVVDYQPPAPDADHEWNAERRRWVKRADVAAAEAKARAAQARIDQLERASWRPLRELQLDPANAEAKRRLGEIEAEIAALRADVTASVH